jgi:GH25 family lysozyme M1 (1,4-beta-N-acetylmuramidase)
MTEIRCIDVSNNDGHIDWKQVAASGIKAEIAKVSEGISFTDPFFIEFTRGAVANSLYAGAYHFARPSRNAPEAEANFFCHQLGASGCLDLLHMPIDPVTGEEMARVWLDQEDPGASGTLGRWTERFCQRVEAVLRQPCGVYLSPGWWEGHNQDAPAGLGNRELWVASYGVSHPSLSSPWKRWVIWQFSDKGRVPGISTAVDLDVIEAGEANSSKEEEEMYVRDVDGKVGATGTIYRVCGETLLAIDSPAHLQELTGAKDINDRSMVISAGGSNPIWKLRVVQ